MANPANPFLKWPGGKRWLAPKIKKLIKSIEFSQFSEPFLGGGAVFFEIRPKQAILSDINSDLINTYVQVRDDPERIISSLKELTVSKETYSRMRALEPTNNRLRAVRFLYLNRTCFSGIYRINSQGKFNVPYGGGERNHSILFSTDLLLKASLALRNCRILTCDFEATISSAKSGDLVYCDPTYTVTHSNNGFIRYNERNFSWQDQLRLASVCNEVAKKNVTIIVSNAYHNEIAKLYKKAERYVFHRNSLLCPDTSKRRSIKEYLFVFK